MSVIQATEPLTQEQVDRLKAQWESYWSSDLHREDWPEFYVRRCEGIAAALEELDEQPQR